MFRGGKMWEEKGEILCFWWFFDAKWVVSGGVNRTFKIPWEDF